MYECASVCVCLYVCVCVCVCVCTKEEREANEKEQANISHYLWYRGTKTLTGQGGFPFHLGHGTGYREWGLITSNWQVGTHTHIHILQI